VRLGNTALAHKDAFKVWVGDLAACFRPAA
jgi:hypothetical protein